MCMRDCRAIEAGGSLPASMLLPTKGNYKIMARAANKIGQRQASTLIANPAGYHHNVVQSLTLVAA
jgi:hypothetical protein